MGVLDISQAIDNEMGTPPSSFPLEIFPKAIRDLINDAKRTKGFDRDFFSAGMLSVCASAIGNSVSLYNGSYNSKPILWIAIIGSRGTGKTHPLSWAIQPINKKDGQAYKDYEIKMQEWEQLPKDTKGKKPMFPKHILKDFTPEKLAETLQYNDKGVLIFQDELMRWINSFDQYKKGGDQQMYLDLFNGSELTVDRITKEPIRVPQTNVNILGGMQPEIVKGLAGNGRSEDGFLDRFLFVYPERSEPNLFTGRDISDHNKENYHKWINNLLETPHQTINADADNVAIFKEWQHTKVKECFNDQLERALQAKLETYVWRLALVIEMMDQGSTGDFNINLKNDSLRKALLLVEYFRLNALRVQEKILSRNPLDDLTPIYVDVYEALPLIFKRSDVLPLFKERVISIRSADRFLKNKYLFDSHQTSKDLKSGEYKKKLK